MHRNIFALAAAASTVTAQTPSFCDKYTIALFKDNTAANQYKLLTAVVNTAVIGNCVYSVFLLWTSTDNRRLRDCQWCCCPWYPRASSSRWCCSRPSSILQRCPRIYQPGRIFRCRCQLPRWWWCICPQGWQTCQWQHLQTIVCTQLPSTDIC